MRDMGHEESSPASLCDRSSLPPPLHQSADLVLPPEPDYHVLPSDQEQQVTSPHAWPHDPAEQAHAMNAIVGGALAPTHTAISPRRQPLRPGPGLRLPSFEHMGIAAPHPDRFANLSLYDPELDRVNGLKSPFYEPIGSELLAAIDRPLQNPADDIVSKVIFGSARTVTVPFRHHVATLTPPAEMGDIPFNPVQVSSAPTVASGMDSPGTDPGAALPISAVDGDAHTATGSSAPGSSSAPSASSSPHSWVDNALTVLLEGLHTAAVPVNPLRVLSHALPSPSQTGHIFPFLIDKIHGSTPSEPTVWINVFHAIQGRFNLADLPTSPPSTPGPAIGGDDYFTQKVFDSAVPISDYQEDLSSLPRSPRPVVPPSSINVAIVERYIPPSTVHEFSDMFNSNGPSVLVDRLVELSPNNGCLLFVYPTKAGAHTFTQEYLGPILDPLLRSIVVVNGLSSNLSTALGRMLAADQLPDFDQVSHSMSALCTKLTQRSSSMQKFHGHRATFALVYASREEVEIDRLTWAKDWWAKQEKQRIREAMTRYTQDAQKKSSNEHVERAPTPTELIQQLLDGVSKTQSYPPGKTPTRGIEVGVFVIKRTD